MEQQFHQKILEELSFLKGQLSETLPAMKADIKTLKDDVSILKDDSIFKKGKTVGIAMVTSVIVSALGYFIPK